MRLRTEAGGAVPCVVAERDLALLVAADLQMMPGTRQRGHHDRCRQVVQELLELMTGADEGEGLVGVAPVGARVGECEFERLRARPTWVSRIAKDLRLSRL